jgi:hypothetical protein
MRTLIVVTSLAMALTPALAQKTDRLPDDPIVPKMVRTISIGAEGQTLPFTGRWDPVGALLANKPSGRAVTTQNAPAASAAPLPTPRPVAKVVDRARDLCERHGLRKVITSGGRSWRCR